ncbi:hypothetical protein INT48_007565 [Thamnidium elegans]|uniref:SAP domain-containing protein n=1 Tax=Thamnidium elegans TaxID=101142 RepID=A0A8H7VXR6_9FUNG|nr:hypothetical protein INT48_007565 [Thamnidium elegans]
MSEKYKSLKVKELQELLQKSGIPHSGKKEDLIERLVRNDELNCNDDLITSDLPSDAIFDDLSLEKPVVYQKESVLSDDEDDFLFYGKKAPVKADPPVQKSTSPTNVITIEDDKKLDDNANSSFKFTPITFEAKAASAVTATTTAATTTTKNTVKKVVKVALPDPKLDEKKRQQIRAARFGITAPATKEEPSKKKPKNVKAPAAATPITASKPKPAISEEILKKRAERFGITSVTKDEDKKQPEKPQDVLKKRAERFGIPAEKPETKTEKPADDFQERLRKRAERFGIPIKAAVPEPKKKLNTPTTNKQTKVNAPTKAAVVGKKKENVKQVFQKVKQGRVQKNTPVTNKKAVTMVVTKNNVLNKKQSNINNRLTPGAINQNKRSIINNRKVNAINNNIPQAKNGRIVTIATAPAKPAQTQRRTSGRNILIHATNPTNMNGRTVTVSSGMKRLRGRGPPPTPVNKKRRN